MCTHYTRNLYNKGETTTKHYSGSIQLSQFIISNPGVWYLYMCHIKISHKNLSIFRPFVGTGPVFENQKGQIRKISFIIMDKPGIICLLLVSSISFNFCLTFGNFKLNSKLTGSIILFPTYRYGTLGSASKL